MITTISAAETTANIHYYLKLDKWTNKKKQNIEERQIISKISEAFKLSVFFFFLCPKQSLPSNNGIYCIINASFVICYIIILVSIRATR